MVRQFCDFANRSHEFAFFYMLSKFDAILVVDTYRRQSFFVAMKMFVM